MKVAVLFSGDVESMMALSKIRQEHEIRYLAVVHSKNTDDYVFHTPNLGLTLLQAEIMNFQLVSKEARSEEDLKILLDDLDIEGVSCDIIDNKYKKKLVEKVCNQLNLKFLTPLTGINQEKLLKDAIKNKFESIISAANHEGFDESWLGRKVDEKCINDLIKLKKKFGISILGENGEYESLVLDCPMFTRKILLTKFENNWKNGKGVLEIMDAKLVEKL